MSNNISDKALRRYAEKITNIPLPTEVLDNIAKTKGLDRFNAVMPHLSEEQILSSEAITKWLRDVQLQINLSNSYTLKLEREIKNSNIERWGITNHIQNQLMGMDSNIDELESQTSEKFSKVHSNSFVRSKDGFDGDHKSVSDYKTKLPFGAKKRLFLAKEAGLLLPIKKQEHIYVKSFEIIKEATDRGEHIIRENSPMNLIDPHIPFQYICGKTAYIENGMKIPNQRAKIGLLCQFSHLEICNGLNIKPANSAGFIINKIDYINESNELVSLQFDSFANDTGINLFFEPIKTQHVYIYIEQASPIDQIQYLPQDILKETISQNSNIPNVQADSIKLNLFDFSMESVTFYRMEFESEGYYISKPQSVKNPLSVRLETNSQAINFTNTLKDYGDHLYLPDNTVLEEGYLEIQLSNDKNNIVFNGTIPVPGNKSVEVELLPFISNECHVRFVPDLFYNANAIKIKSALYYGEYVVIEFEKTHGITDYSVQSDKIEIFINRETDTLNCQSTEWRILSDDSIVVKRNDGASVTYYVPETFTPKGKVFFNQDLSFEVKKENTTLVLGSDYLYSLDEGNSWHSERIDYATYQKYSDNIYAGSFKVKILKPIHNGYYWITYKKAKNQFLHKSRMILLKNKVVVFHKKLHHLRGGIKTILVLRSNNRTPYISSVIHNYALKVKEL